MPSVGSTPTTTSPSQQHQPPMQSLTTSPPPPPSIQPPQQTNASTQHPKLQQQHSLPLQLQYHHHQPQVTTTQPSPAGTYISQAGIITTAGSGLRRHHGNGGGGGDISPTLSSSNSYSSVDTNHTLLNSIAAANQAQQQRTSNNRNSAYRTKYSQFMIITPAVSIDRGFEREAGETNAAADNDFEDAYEAFSNGNIFRMSLLQSSIDSGNSSDSSFRSNYNPYLHTSRQHLLPKSAPPHFYTFSSWRWCTLICAAMRCFGGGRNTHASYSTSFARPPYHRSRSSGGAHTSSSMPHHRLRSSSFTAETAYEHFAAPFKPRKTRDHLNNITYEL